MTTRAGRITVELKWSAVEHLSMSQGVVEDGHTESGWLLRHPDGKLKLRLDLTRRMAGLVARGLIRELAKETE